jgi:putative two-component system protein, hydrogenase maturation factor HypX/HoxX
LVSSIIFAEEVVTIASFSRNAGAGGAFMGLACDYVLGREGVVLNPHYKTLGLSGSEYHTYTLPKRVGEQRAEALLNECLPLSVEKAKSIGMIDEVFSSENYYEEVHSFAKTAFDDEFIWDKQNYLEANRAKIQAHKEEELAIMYPEFWDDTSDFHHLRQEFVYKVCPKQTPKRLRYQASKEDICMNIV